MYKGKWLIRMDISVIYNFVFGKDGLFSSTNQVKIWKAYNFKKRYLDSRFLICQRDVANNSKSHLSSGLLLKVLSVHLSLAFFYSHDILGSLWLTFFKVTDLTAVLLLSSWYPKFCLQPRLFFLGVCPVYLKTY